MPCEWTMPFGVPVVPEEMDNLMITIMVVPVVTLKSLFLLLLVNKCN